VRPYSLHFQQTEEYWKNINYIMLGRMFLNLKTKKGKKGESNFTHHPAKV
jgi:hypothetical protein